MNIRGIYTIYKEPVPLKQVFEGLWVGDEQPNAMAELISDEEFFKSAELFKKPLVKAKPKKKIAPFATSAE